MEASNTLNTTEFDLQTLGQFCPVAIAVVDRAMNYVWLNQKWLEDLGSAVQLHDVLGKSHYDFFQLTAEQKDNFRRCLVGDLLSYKDELILSQGVLRWQAKPYYGQTQQPQQISGLIVTHEIVVDSMAQKYAACMQQRSRLEQELSQQAAELAQEIKDRVAAEESYAQLGTALESTSDAIGIFDTKGFPTFVNTAFLDLFGYSFAELRKRGMSSLFVQQAIAEQVQHCLRQGGSWAGEVDMHTSSGIIIPVAMRTNSIRDPDGKISGAVGIYTNISDRKAAELETQQGFSLLNATLEATADGLVVEDLNGNIMICNQKFADLWRIPPNLIQSLRTLEIKQHILSQVANPQAFSRLISHLTPEADSFDLVKLKDGRTIERYSQPQRINGQCVGRVWGYRDISSRIIAEEALRSSEQRSRQQAEQLETALKQLKSTQAQLIQTEKLSGLGQLIAGISHEINNPINYIYGNLAPANDYIDQIIELLHLFLHYYPQPDPVIQSKLREIELDYITEDLKKIMSSIRLGAERIHNLVQSLHKFARADSSQCRYADLHAGIESTLVILQNRLKANRERGEIQVIRNYCQMPNVECFPSQMNQVFMNIIANAIDALDDTFRPAEETTASELAWERTWEKPDDWIPCIWITTEVRQGSIAVIRIQDNAGGMPAFIKQRIFDPFFTTKPVGKGTGLGLSISYQIITENHNGKLTCNSQEGIGTEFVIEIPILQSSSDGTTDLTKSLLHQ
jgi:two-component system NtrC family sensor kinase